MYASRLGNKLAELIEHIEQSIPKCMRLHYYFPKPDLRICHQILFSIPKKIPLKPELHPKSSKAPEKFLRHQYSLYRFTTAYQPHVARLSEV
jgi:hypothetical protein